MKNRKLCELKDSSIFVIRLLAAACGTVVVFTHAAQLSGLSFRLYAVLVTAIIASAFLILALVARRAPRPPLRFALLLAAMLVSGILGAALFRPDADDFYYLPSAAWFKAHPEKPLDFGVHGLLLPSPLASPHWANSFPFELAQAAIAYCTGIPLEWIYYIVSVVFFSTLIPLVWYSTSRALGCSSQGSLLGSLLVVPVLLLLGEEHKAIGNLFLNRIFQGKIVFYSLGIPLLLTLLFSALTRRKGYVFLALGLAFCTGLSPSGALLGILLCAIFGLAFLAASAISKPGASNIVHSTVSPMLLLLAAQIYPLIYLLTIFFYSRADLSSASIVNQSAPATFLEHFGWLWSAPLQVLVTATSIAATGFFLRHKQLRLVISLTTAVTIICILNPFAMQLWVPAVFAPDIYWRTIFLLPFPLSLVLLGEVLWPRLETLNPARRQILGGLCLLALFLPHFVKNSPSVFQQGGTELCRFCIKLPEDAVKEARQVIDCAPPGGVLAPPLLAGTVAILSGRHPQVRLRETGEMLWLGKLGLADEAGLRIKASNELQAGTGISEESIIRLIRMNPKVKSIVDSNLLLVGPYQLLLEQLGYERKCSGGRVFVKKKKKTPANDF